MRDRYYAQEDDDRSTLPERDEDGGIKMQSKPLPHWYTPAAAASSGGGNNADGAPPLKDKKRQRKQNELPALKSFPAALRSTNNPIHCKPESTCTCPTCGRSFQIDWGHRPTMDEVKAWRDQVLNHHRCDRSPKRGRGR